MQAAKRRTTGRADNGGHELHAVEPILDLALDVVKRFEDVRRDRVRTVGVCRAPESVLLSGHEACGSHQAGDSLGADADALLAERAVDPRASVTLAALLMRRDDVDHELVIGASPSAFRPLFPGTKAGSTGRRPCITERPRP